MRRRRSVLVGGVGLLFLCLCGLLALGVGALFRFGHVCGPATARANGANVTVRQGETAESVKACGGNVLVLGHVTGDVASYGGNVTIESSGSVDGDVSSYGGGVQVVGTVQGDVKSFGGRVAVTGSVQGDVSGYGGSVTIASTGLVHGDVTAYGGGVKQAPGAQVQGAVHGNQGPQVGGNVFSIFGSFALNFSWWSLLIWLALTGAVVHWLPGRMQRVSEVSVRRLPRSLLVGALSWVLGLILAFILAITIIGIPLAIGIVLVLVAGVILGNVAIGWVLGRVVLQRFSSQPHSRLLEAMLGIVLLALLGAVPFFGALLNLFIAVVGVGATLLSRFGSRRTNTGSLRRWVA